MLFKRFELSTYRNLTELCTTPAWAVLLVHRSMSNAPSYNVYRIQGKFEYCKLLLELFRLIAMNYGQKLFNPLSWVARLQQMTMTRGRITNYTSCVAREPLWRGAQSRFAIKTLPKSVRELLFSMYYCPVMSKAGQMKQANFAKAFLTQANRVTEVTFHTCRYVSVVLQISYQIQLIVTLKY